MPVAPTPASSIPPSQRNTVNMSWRKPVPTYHPPQPTFPPMDLGDRLTPVDVPSSPTGSVDLTLQGESEDGHRRSREEHWEEALQKLSDYRLQAGGTATRPASPFSAPVVAPLEASPARRPSEGPSTVSRRPSISNLSYLPQNVPVTLELSPTIVVTHSPQPTSRQPSASTRSLRKASSANIYRPPTPPRSHAKTMQSQPTPVGSSSRAPAGVQSQMLGDERADIQMRQISHKPSNAGSLYDPSLTVTARPSVQSLKSGNTFVSRSDTLDQPPSLYAQWSYAREDEGPRKVLKEQLRVGDLHREAGVPQTWIDIPSNVQPGEPNPMHIVSLNRFSGREKRRGCGEKFCDAVFCFARAFTEWLCCAGPVAEPSAV